MDSDLLKYGGGFSCGKVYMSGLDGRAIELGRPKDFADWYDPIISDMVTIKLPKHYIINDGATILFWKDGTKTVVKRSKDEKFDKRLGFLTAYFQKHCGMSKTKANKFLDNLEVQE